MSNKKIRFSILASDLVWSLLALFASVLFRYRATVNRALSTLVSTNFLLVAGLSVAAWLLLSLMMDLDCFRYGWQTSATISRTSLAVLFQLAIISSCGYFARLYYSRLVLLCYFVLLWAGIVLIRFGAHELMRAQERTGRARKVVLIGDLNMSREIAYRIGRHPELLYAIVGLLTPYGHADASCQTDSVECSSGLTSLDATEFLKKKGVQELIVCMKHAPALEMQNFLARCKQEGMHIHVLPQPYELYVSRPKLTEVDGIPLLSFDIPRFSKVALATKRVFDLGVAALLIVPAAVILSVVGASLWLRDRRFVRREIRCGRNGQPFAMYRLDVQTDEPSAPHFHRILHRLSISELPQILNVFRGDMSLVGPRPEPPERVRDYSEWQKQRLKALPGMTGLAQVNGLREHNSSDEKTRFDLQYMLYWTPLVDLVLLLQTFWTLAGRLLSQRWQSAPLNRDNSRAPQQSTPTAAGASGD